MRGFVLTIWSSCLWPVAVRGEELAVAPSTHAETQQARTPGRPVRAKLCHAIFLARSDSAFFAACRAAWVYAPGPKHPTSRRHLALSICSKLASIP